MGSGGVSGETISSGRISGKVSSRVSRVSGGASGGVSGGTISSGRISGKVSSRVSRISGGASGGAISSVPTLSVGTPTTSLVGDVSVSLFSSEITSCSGLKTFSVGASTSSSTGAIGSAFVTEKENTKPRIKIANKSTVVVLMIRRVIFFIATFMSLTLDHANYTTLKRKKPLIKELLWIILNISPKSQNPRQF